MNNKLLLILAVGMMIAAIGLWSWQHNNNNNQPIDITKTMLPAIADGTQIATTYTPPVNTYLPVMMFLVVKDTDKPVFTRCKNMTYRVVDTYSRRENDDLDREDRKLKTLARLIYSECIDVALLTHLEGI